MKKSLSFITCLSLLLFLSPFNILSAALKVTVIPDSIIQSKNFSTIYYYASDGNRYIFPTEQTYGSWFIDYSKVVNISEEELALIPLKGNITYRPGVRMVKIQTSPRVYVVEAGGILRWIESEEMAVKLYGTDWNKKIDDIPDVFFTNYKEDKPIKDTKDYVPETVVSSVQTINKDRGITESASAPKATTGVGSSTIPAVPATPHPGQGIPATPATPARHGNSTSTPSGVATTTPSGTTPATPAIPAIPATHSTSTATTTPATPAIPATPATPPSKTYCGDGIIQSPNQTKTGGPNNDGYEQCDGSDITYQGWGYHCSADCTIARCSSGQIRPCHIQAGTEISRGLQSCQSDGLWGQCDIIPPPVLTEVAPVVTPTNDNTPSYTFHSTGAGAIAYYGLCTSNNTTAVVGNNTITFNTLADGNYDNCSIKIQDAAMNLSQALTITPFTVVTWIVTKQGAWPGSNTPPGEVWNGTKYGVTWHDSRDGNNEIYFALKDTANNNINDLRTVKPTDIRITNSSGDSYYPKIAWNGSEFGIVWDDARGGYSKIYFARVSADGVKLSEDINIINSATLAGGQQIIWTGSSYAITYFSSDSGREEIYFAFISSNGTLEKNNKITSSNSSVSPQFAWTGSEFGVAWHGDGVSFVKVDSNGNKIGTVSKIPGSWAYVQSVVYSAPYYTVTYAGPDRYIYTAVGR